MANLVGKKFFKLTVIEEVEKPSSGSYTNDTGKHRWWLCKCECGGTTTLPTKYVNNGKVKSCGCKKNSKDRNGN